MNLLFIWDGRNSLPESRAEGIKRTLDLYPEAIPYCITRNKSFVSERFQIIPWDPLLIEMADYFAFKQMPYRWHEPVTFSDWARFYWLALHGDTLYLDTDAAMVKRYAFDREYKLVYSPRNICLLYAPAVFPREHLLSLLAARARQHVGILLDLVGKFRPEWSKPIPSEFFQHRGAV
jgi:hypothetical protein